LGNIANLLFRKFFLTPKMVHWPKNFWRRGGGINLFLLLILVCYFAYCKIYRRCLHIRISKPVIFVYLFVYLALPTMAGSPQQHYANYCGPFYLTHPVNFPCGRKPRYPEKTHDFRQSVDFYSFHMRTGFKRVALRKFSLRFESERVAQWINLP
jgi:hypothetical protein